MNKYLYNKMLDDRHINKLIENVLSEHMKWWNYSKLSVKNQIRRIQLLIVYNYYIKLISSYLLNELDLDLGFLIP